MLYARARMQWQSAMQRLIWRRFQLGWFKEPGFACLLEDAPLSANPCGVASTPSAGNV